MVMFTIMEVISTRALKEDEAYVNAAVLSINPKKASVILAKLASLLPLEAHNLDHLKRVRKQRNKEGEPDVEFIDEESGDKVLYPFQLQVLLCPAQAFGTAANVSVRNLLGLSTDAVVDDANTAAAQQSSLVRLQSIKVCRVAPETRSEFDEWNSLWPTTFRADHLTRERSKGPVHSAEEEEQVGRYMRMVEEDGKVCAEIAAAVAAIKGAPGPVLCAPVPLEEDAAAAAVPSVPFIKDSTSAAREKEEERGSAVGRDPTLLSGGIVVNPATGQVVARSADFFTTLLLLRKRQQQQRHSGKSAMCVSDADGDSGSAALRHPLHNPLNTSTMRCIEMVAAVVRGEVQFPTLAPAPALAAGAASTLRVPAQSLTGAGIGLGTAMQFPSDASEVVASKMGGARGRNRLNAATTSESTSGQREVSTSSDFDRHSEEDSYAQFLEDQYLCTDLDLYLQCEPDTMAAMALVHSRIRRVYFLETHPDGAISTRLHVHEMRQLNHRYRAFHCIEREQ